MKRDRVKYAYNMITLGGNNEGYLRSFCTAVLNDVVGTWVKRRE